MKKSLLFLTLLLAISINAQTEFTATDDVYVRGGENSGTNYNEAGGAERPELEVKVGTNPNFFKRTLIKFDLSGSGLSGADVNNARLRLRVMDVQKAAIEDVVTVTVSGVTDTWAEGTVTWGDAPASGTALSTDVISGDDKPTVKDGPGGVDKFWDVKSFVVTELDGDQIISFVLEDLAAINNTITFSSKAGANAPTLVINDPSLSTSNFDSEKNKISLYPNPAQNAFEIQTPNSEISNVKIFSINGSMLFNRKNVNTNKLAVNTAAFQTGVYFVHIKNARGAVSIKKLIKE